MAEAAKFEIEYEAQAQESEMYKEIANDEVLLNLMVNKEELQGFLESSKENVESRIDDKDNEITKAI